MICATANMLIQIISKLLIFSQTKLVSATRAKMRKFGNCILFFLCTVLIEEIKTTEEASNADVDNFINEYVKEVRRTLRIGLGHHTINKRSNPDIDLNKLTGLELLVGFQEMYSIPSRSPHDLILFAHCLPDQKQWYSAALETKDLLDTELVLYKYQGEAWLETHRVSAAGGQSIAAEQIRGSMYLVVAQYLKDEALGSTVWRLSSNSNTLQFIHMLNTRLAAHAIMWTDTYTTYAAVAVSENPAGSQKRYSTQSPVYRWLGSSFDMIDTLPTYNPRALVQFNIRSSIFLAVANFQNDFGETMIDSEIFRYDLTSGKFNVYQKLPTEAAVDIKSFCFQSNQITESFLIYASAFHTDERGMKDYNSPSVVYKLSDEEYFVPFQALQVSKVTSWLPVRHVKNGLESLTLVGANEEGIISFQYDGWRFVPTGLHYDRSAFGPGPKSLNVFYFNDQAFISVANTYGTRYEVNVFSPVFKHHPGVKNMQKIISEWVEEMTQEMIEGEAKMIELTRIAREAPSVNDAVIELGSHAVFRNAEIYNLKTIETKVGDSNADVLVYNKLLHLKSKLYSLNQTLAGLPNRIDQTSFHSYTVYEDIIEDSADISCTHSCHVQDLEVTNVNGENLSEFLENTVNIKEAVELQGEISFKELALTEPLNTKLINGHMKETLIDWSKEVVIDHKLKVEGDVLAKNSILVTEAVDGVFLNVVRKEEMFEPKVIVSPTRKIKSLNTSQLMLSDGNLSEVDFRNFVLSTLKTQGDQIFSEFQDFGRVEAEEVTAPDLYKAVSLPSMSQQRSCEEENCSIDGTMPHNVTSRARSKKIESINLLDDVVIIPRNFTLYGTVVVENGSLTAKDFVDLKHNVSAEKLAQFSIPLSQSKIEQHFKFEEELKTPMLNVDTLNSLPIASLVMVEEEGDIRLSGKKMFHGSLAIMDETLRVTGAINGLKHLKEDEEDLEPVQLDYLNVDKINSGNMRIGLNEWQKHATMLKDGTVVFKTLNVEENVFANSVMVRGNVSNYHLEKLLNDTVYEGDDNLLITGTKHFTGESEILNLNVNPSNSTNVHFVIPQSLWRKRLLQAKVIEVDQLFYTGKLDGLESSVFGRWLLTEGDQSITASQAATSLQALDMAMSPSATFNSINISHVLTQAVLTSDNATFDSVIFEEPVISSVVQVGGRMSGLEVPADIVVADTTVDQLIAGHKRVLGSVSLAGDLLTFGLVSAVNITNYCQAFLSHDSNLTISGDGKFKQELEILTSVNGIEWPDVTRSIWFKENDVTISEKVLMNEVDFQKVAVKNINNNNVEEQLSRLVSLSNDQDINGTFYFTNILAERGLTADEATVGGDVQGIQLSSFIKTVLLNRANQEIEGYFDFTRLVIENEFDNKGFVNGLNISTDLMFTNVASNTVTAEVTLGHLYTRTLRLRHGALVAGVDINRWNTTAVTKSGIKHVITGNVTVLGQLDSGQGIRVESLVNGVPFNQSNVMLSDGSQKVTGKKTFSSESDLTIHELKVEGLFNDLNITDFYQQQVTAEGNVSILGRKQFISPLWSERVVLPEVYQDHNLTWLEYQLSAPLPWSSYYGQLANIQQSHQIASRCLAGSAYYMKNMTRARDVEGDVLFTLPLKSGNASVLGVVRRDSTEARRLTLSLLHWSDKQNMFTHMPGSVNYFPRVVPSEVQMITLPGGELAAYVTSYLPHNETSSVVGHGDLFRLKDGLITQTEVHGGKPGSTLLSFLDYKQRTCFIVVADRCRVHCYSEGRPTVRLPSFSCNNITKATLLMTDRGHYVLGVQTQLQGSLFLWRMSGRKFSLVLELPQFNPVSIAATTTTGPHVAVANMHRPGHSHPETVNVYRLNENTSQLELQQSLPAVSPSLVVFSSLPSSESVLYVASLVPASPLRVYIYRGILGYQLLTSDPTLPIPSDLQPFTDHQQRHFLVVPSHHSATMLRGEFEGIS